MRVRRTHVPAALALLVLTVSAHCQTRPAAETAYARPVAVPFSVTGPQFRELERRHNALWEPLEAARGVNDADRADELTREMEQIRSEMERLIAGGPPGRRLRYVPSHPKLAVWRKPSRFAEIPPDGLDWGEGPGTFADPAPGSGTVHPFAKVVRFEYGGRTIALAIDAADPHADAFDAVQVDMGGEGDFHDTRLLPFHAGGGLDWEYGPAVVPVTLDGQRAPLMVWGRYDRWERDWGRWYVTMFEGYPAAECVVPIAGEDYLVRIIDSSMNWKLGDAPTPAPDMNPYWSGDSLAVETGDGYFTDPETLLKVWYGQPVEIGGRLYDVRVAADGRRLEAEPLPADEVGTLRVAGAKGWWGVVVSDDRALNVSTQAGSDVPVPAGSYHILAVGARFDEDGEMRPVRPGSVSEAVTVPGGGVGTIPVPD